MDREYWSRLKTAFHEIFEIPDGERAARLLHLRNTDPKLYDDVLGLLEEDRRATSRDWWPVGRGLKPRTCFSGNSRFELLECIGSGGFGVVHRAYDRRDERVIALKVLHTQAPDTLLSFKQEFRSVADQRHPNLVAVHELFVEAQHAFFTMDLVEGVPITKYLADGLEAARTGGQYFRRLRSVFGQLGRGLLALHRASVLHRDLKPSNVLVTTSGQVVILDFGLAETIGSAFHQCWGTPEYMAPELLAGNRATTQSDWYSVGVLLHECLAAASAVHSSRAESSPVVPRGEPTRGISESDLGVPEELARICKGLLSPDPKLRPRARAFLSVFEESPTERDDYPNSDRRAFCPFVGREEHITELVRCFERATAGRLVVAKVRGRSGFGKTALLHEFSTRIASRFPNGLVLCGRCHERENLGYRVFDGIVDALVRHLLQCEPDVLRSWLPLHSTELRTLFPAFGLVTERAGIETRPVETLLPTEQRLNAFSALRELLARIGQERPLVVLADDLQWGDTDSEPLLRHLLSHAELPLLLVVAYREEDLGSPRLNQLISALDAAVDVSTIDVGPLDCDDVEQLLKLQLGAAHPLIPTVIASREGTPLVLDWLVEELRSTPDDARSVLGALAFESLLWRAVERLSPDARRLLSLLAIGSRPIPREVLYDALAVAREAACNAEDVLRARRMVRFGVDDSLESAHDRLRQALVEHLEPAERRELHGALLDALPQDSDIEALAFHAISAERTELARIYCIESGKRCAGALAFDRAATYYQQALLLGLQPPRLEADVRMRLAEVMAHAGRGREAAEQYLSAASLLSERSFELRLLAGQQFMRCGEVVAGRRLLLDLLSQRGLLVPENRWRLGWQTLLLRARVNLAPIPERIIAREASPEARLILDTLWPLSGGLALVDTIGSMYFQTRHLAVALRTGDSPEQIRALSLEAVLASVEGRWSKRRCAALLALLSRHTHHDTHPTAVAMIHLAHGIVAWMQCDFVQCSRMTDRAEALLQHGTGQSFELATNRAFALASLIWLGRLSEHAARFEPLYEDATQRSDLHAQSSLVLLAHAHVAWLARDDARRARGVVCRTLEAWPVQREFSLQHVWAWFALVEIALYEGNLDLAASIVQRDWSKVRRSAHMQIGPIRIWMNQLRARVALAELASLRRTNQPENRAAKRQQKPLLRLIKSQLRRLERESLPLGRALHALTAGLVARAAGRDAVAARHYHGALEMFVALDMRLHASASRWAMAASSGTYATSDGEAAEKDARQLGITTPTRFMAMLVPGA